MVTTKLMQTIRKKLNPFHSGMPVETLIDEVLDFSDEWSETDVRGAVYGMLVCGEIAKTDDGERVLIP